MENPKQASCCLSLGLLLQHPATPLQASCFDSHSIFHWHWTEKIIFLLPLGSCSCTDMENYFRGSLDHKHYFCFHFFLPLPSPPPLLFCAPALHLFHSQWGGFTRGLERSLRVGDLVCLSIPRVANGENPFSMYNSSNTHLNDTCCMLSIRPSLPPFPIHCAHNALLDSRCVSLTDYVLYHPE